MLAASVILALAMGQIVNGLSVFFLPLETELCWQRGDISLINTAGLFGLAAGGIAIGRVVGRFGIRRICVVGALVLSFCIIAASFAGELWQFYVLFLIAGAFGGGAFFAPMLALVGNWFTTGSGLALGVVSAGQALGQGVVPFVAARLIEDMGWRSAFMALGLASITIVVPMAMLLRDPPDTTDGARTNANAPSPVPLPHWLVVSMLGAAVLGCCILMAIPLVHLVPFMQGCGVPAADAGGVMFVMLTAGIAGRIFFGRLADSVGGPFAYMAASAWQTALVFGFTWFDSADAFYLYAPLYGFGFAGVMTGVLTTVRAVTPPPGRAATLGVIAAFAFAAHGVGGYAGGVLFDLTGSYTASFTAAAASGIFNLIVTSLLVLMIHLRGTNPISLGRPAVVTAPG